MSLSHVVLTGFDESSIIKSEKLIELSNKYPEKVEWGILLHKNKNSGRYANKLVLNEIEKIKSNNQNICFSLHVCGKDYLEDILSEGDWKILLDDLGSSLDIFSKIQVNIFDMIDLLCFENFFNSEDFYYLNQEIILQIRDFKNIELLEKIKKYKESSLQNVNIFYDASGGKGILPETWPSSLDYCGYGGGLTPENVKSNINKIMNVNSSYFWIDAESSLRTNDLFDFEKCELFLKNSFN